MIKIFNKNLNNEKIVTKGAYKEFYEHLGYEIVDEKKEKPLVTKEETNKNEHKDNEKIDKIIKESYSRK